MSGATDTRPFSAEELSWLEQVGCGADIYERRVAEFLRHVARLDPPLVGLVPARRPPKSGAARQPYFGAILTRAGRDALLAGRGGSEW